MGKKASSTKNICLLNIDHRMMCLGRDTSWGRIIHEEYRIPAKEYSYSFVIPVREKLEYQHK